MTTFPDDRGAAVNPLSRWRGVVMLLAVLSLSACNESPSEHEPPTGGLMAWQLIENPSAYAGKTVTVSGYIDRIYGPRAFSLDSGVNSGQLLVLGRESFPPPTAAAGGDYLTDHVATVTGVVRPFVRAEVERALGWAVEPHLAVDFDAKPVVIAQTVHFTRNPADKAAAAIPPITGSDAAPDAAPITALATIIDAPDPSALIGRPVQLTEVNVDSIVSDRGFWLGDRDRRVFARLDERLDQGAAEWDVAIRPGQTRTLTGDLRPLPAIDQIRQWKFIEEADIQALQDRRLYLHVTHLRDTRRPLTQ